MPRPRAHALPEDVADTLARLTDEADVRTGRRTGPPSHAHRRLVAYVRALLAAGWAAPALATPMGYSPNGVRGLATRPMDPADVDDLPTPTAPPPVAHGPAPRPPRPLPPEAAAHLRRLYLATTGHPPGSGQRERAHLRTYARALHAARWSVPAIAHGAGVTRRAAAYWCAARPTLLDPPRHQLPPVPRP